MIEQFAQSDLGIAIYTTLALTAVNFISGIAAAWRDNTLEWSAIDAFIRAHIMGRVVPILMLLFSGFLLDDLVAATLVGAGLVSVAAYATATVASIGKYWVGEHVVKDVPQE